MEGSPFKDVATSASQPTGAAGSDHPTDSSSTPAQQGIAPPVDPAIQATLEERRRRLEIDKKEKEAAEKAERRARQEDQRAAADPDSRLAKQHKYAQLQKKRQLQERQERERILRVIENDKAERKHKEELRKALAAAQAGSEVSDGAAGLVDCQLADEMKQPRSRPSNTCAVQVRLFDGSTIRSTFPLDQTLRKNVRQWLNDQKADNDVPYTFRQILAPLPNRPISISEEEESLQSLGLTPSATLVMVPVQSYSAAYDPGQGYVAKGLSAGYNLASGCIGVVTGAIETFLGVGNGTAVTTQTGSTTRGGTQADPTDSSPGINIRTLRDQTNRDEQQFYNGNQLNFEPRRDDAKED
ncbi:hypothetical protein MMC30_005833 [Trapelia coarctata]|nr:hypothetical protein [Trapelia coarctata]